MADVGVYGLGTIGNGIIRNFARHGRKVAIFNRTTEKAHQFVENFGSEGDMKSYDTPEEFVSALNKPRVIIIVIPEFTVMNVIQQLLPLLEKGDILIDGGNSHWDNTSEHLKYVEKQGIHFVGMGISGGTMGALDGPALMPGGSPEAWKTIRPLLEPIAAIGLEDKPCVAWMGEGGVGHLAKSIHNGIEYAIMGAMAEVYFIMRMQGMTVEQIGKILHEWDSTPNLNSFLLEEAVKVLSFKEKGKDGKAVYVIDEIRDVAAQKGTGAWVAELGIRMGIPVPIETAAVMSRATSGDCARLDDKLRTLREKEGNPKDDEVSKEIHIPTNDELRQTMEISFILSFLEGLRLLRRAADKEGWKIDLKASLRVWTGGCIIRCNLIDTILRKLKPDDELLGMDELITTDGLQALRRCVAYSVLNHGPVPVISAALTSLDTIIARELPHSLIQGVRDSFGAHTVELRSGSGPVHIDWK